MIFYLATDPEGRDQLAGTQADARAVNKDFQQIDIPTDKAGLMAYIQKLMDAAQVAPEPTPKPVPVTPSQPTADQQFIAKVEREITVEEEIQKCELPRLATLAQNVAWRFEELARMYKKSA